MQLNMQEPERADHKADGSLEVVDVFRTIQGEGPFAGRVAVFVRLAGCNLRCPECDTDYTTGRRRAGVRVLSEEVRAAFGDLHTHEGRLVVLTGGEPFRQNVAPLVRQLIDDGCWVQVETNGTIYLDDFPYLGRVTLVVSPKVGRVNEKLRPYVKHLKYVVEFGKVDPATGLPKNTLGNPAQVDPPWPGFAGTVWVQPADQQNDIANGLNVEQALESCFNHDHRLSFQLHKVIGVK
jgi:organic radical activating enzyme